MRERFKPTTTGGSAKDEVTDAHAAIANGADAVKMGKRFKERMCVPGRSPRRLTRVFGREA